MDSKQLYRLFENKFHLSNWLNENGGLAQSDGEVKWSYCGVNEDFKSEVVSRAIDAVSDDDEVYLCISPNSSSLVSKANAVEGIRTALHKKEIGVIDRSLTKILFFNQYGTFSSGVIREFPESRPRPAGQPLKVSFHANIVDENTDRASDIISSRFSDIEKELCKDYGGNMESLWIDLELAEAHMKNRNPYPYRFQKRVSIPSSYTEFYTYNVGHYSVKPDFEKLKGLSSEESICSYLFELLYDSTQILVDRQKKLDGFKATDFRLDFLFACERLGFIARPVITMDGVNG